MSLAKHKQSAVALFQASYAQYVDKVVLIDISALFESIIDSTAEETKSAITPERISTLGDERDPSMANGYNEAVEAVQKRWEEFTT